MPPSATHGSKMRVRSLPSDQWPMADRTAWAAACKPGPRLRRGGAASHLKPITRNDLARRYGYFLDFLQRRGRLDPNAQAAAQVTPANVEAYIVELKIRVGSVTLYGSIYKLRRASQLLAPQHDLSWLIETEKDLAQLMQPRSKTDRLVLTEVLVEAGLTLIAEAEAASQLSMLARARQVRNGLMMVLLALCPIRLKNFAALEIGRTFVQNKGRWWIVLSPSETKERRADERPIDDLIRPVIDRYLSLCRPVLARSDSPPESLWLSSNDGTPMSYSAVERAISETTRSTIGIGLSPHLFRAAAASTAAIYSGDDPYLGTAVVHHAHSEVAEKHYNYASGLSAASAYQEIVRRYRRI